MNMTSEQLLLECEQLTHRGRMRRMVEVGQLATSDASVAETLADLAQGDVYRRLLALQSCYGSQDAAHVVRALLDPSRAVRSLALVLAGLICNDAELPAVLATLSLQMRRGLLRWLHRRRRYAPIDSYLEGLAAGGDEALVELLSFGSRAMNVRYLDQVSERLDLVTLRRIGRRYPELIVTQLSARAQASETIDPRLIIQVNAILPHLSEEAADLALDLVRTLMAVIPLARLDVQPLVFKRPGEMVDLLVQSGEQSRLRFDQVVQHLDTERLLILFTRYPHNISIKCFGKLEPQQRFVIYAACERGWRNSEGILAYSIVEQLSTEQRIEEGRRHLGLSVLLTRPQERLRYAAFLPWDEAYALLETPLRSPDADLRAVVLQTLIAATRYQRGHLVDILQLLLRRRNEQDPVRREIFAALCALPHGIWRTEHLDNLSQLIKDAFNATDLSTITVSAIERLIVYLFPFHAEWSAEQLVNVYSKQSRISFYQLDRYLLDADIPRLVPGLTSLLQAWQRRESEGLLVALARALGWRLRVFDQLAEQLEVVLKETLNSSIANAALNLLLEYRRERSAVLIPMLLLRDQSAIELPPVYMHLHRHRQDLLTAFLGQHAYQGRFSTGKTRFVPPLSAGFQRWTPVQQETFARTLLEIVDDKDQNRATRELLATIQSLSSMPFLDPAPLIRLASDERQPVRDAALRALGRLDAGQGIPTLLEALNDDRARIAIYALRLALLLMPQQEALNLLRAVPLTRITVAKEVVRLIGDLSSEAAYRELLAMEARELHRDVRVALYRALWPYMERPETWDVFTRAAQSSDVALARGVVQIPEDGLSQATQRRLVAVSAILLSHPEPEVRKAVLQWRSLHPLMDTDQILFTHLLALMNSQIPDECAQAARTVFSIYTGNDAALAGSAIRGLLSNRRALQIAIGSFTSTLPAQRKRLLPTTRAILEALGEDPLTIMLRIDLIIQGLPWEEIVPEIEKISDHLHANALIKAQSAIQQASVSPDAQLRELETVFMQSQNPGLRRLALAALIAQSSQTSGWTDECIARLHIYRNDPAPLVAEAAQFTFTA